jgi:hypothetical protein
VNDVLNANIADMILAPMILLAIPAGWIDDEMVFDIPATDYRVFTSILSGVHGQTHEYPFNEIIQHKLFVT